MASKKRPNLDQIKTAEGIKRRKKLGEFEKASKKHKTKTWQEKAVDGYEIRYHVYPTAREKNKKPVWTKTPNYRRLMSVGIWVLSPGSGTRRTWKLYKVLQETPSYLRASELRIWESELQATVNSLKPNTNNVLTLKGKTMREALNAVAINLVPGDRIALVVKMKYETEDEIEETSVSYVEQFKTWYGGATMLSILRNGLANNLRGSLSANQVTFTNAKTMQNIYDKNASKVSKILAKYGLAYEDDTRVESILAKLLDAAGYFEVKDARAFNDKKFLRDYSQVKELYIPQKQLDAKLNMDETKKVTIILDYRFLERRN